jgi:GT2 family glycosyltransferase
MKLSVIIVNYNVKFFLEQCLQSVMLALEGIDAEVFVVDNHSSDRSVEMLKEKFPNIQLIINQENVGFSKANNQVIRQARGEYVLLLNPDTLVEKDTFVKCIDFMNQTPDAGALGVKMLNAKGEFLPESKRGLPLPAIAFYKIFGLSKIFPHSKKFGSYHLTYLDNNQIHSIEVLSGAYMFLRKSVLDQIGYLDEDYFMYGEDIDLSYRIIQAGYKNYYFPETQIIHYKGESTKKSSLNYVFVFYRAMQIFAKKHFSSQNNKIFNLLINLAIWLRASGATLKRIGQKLLLPILDAIVIYAGMLAGAVYWQNTVLFYRNSSYPDYYFYLVIPIYILIWIVSIALARGYHKPYQPFPANKGIFLGTILILIVYALLPESMRFSRAITIFGSLWSIVALNTIRYLFYRLNIPGFYRKGIYTGKRIVVVGNKEERLRVRDLAQQLYTNSTLLLTFSLVEEKNMEKECVGMFSDLAQWIRIFDIDEVILCSKDLSIKDIILILTQYKDEKIDIKVAPSDMTAIIGANSMSSLETKYEFRPQSLQHSLNRRKKRFFDICSSVLLLLSFPFYFFTIHKKFTYLKNVWKILNGKQTWIAYHIQNEKFTKPALLFPEDFFHITFSSSKTINQIHQVYTENYSILHDIRIVCKNLRKF